MTLRARFAVAEYRLLMAAGDAVGLAELWGSADDETAAALGAEGDRMYDETFPEDGPDADDPHETPRADR